MVFQNGSFVQSQAHVSKSEKFVPVQPSQIATVLDGHGFDLVGLKTGRARVADRADFQTTIARYRSRDAFGIAGLNFDILFKIPHLYGAIEARLGFFRGACANQWNAGQLIERAKVRHVGDTLSQIDQLIPYLVSQRDGIVDCIKAMQARDVSPNELVQLATQVANLRLEGSQNVTAIQAQDLLKVRRADDAGQDLFSVLNVLQENATRYGIRYQTVSQDENGIKTVRNMTARPTLKRDKNGTSELETLKSVDLTGSIWDLGRQMLSQSKAA